MIQEKKDQYTEFIRTTYLLGQNQQLIGIPELDSPNYGNCQPHNREITRVCIFQECGDNLICVSCTEDQHAHTDTKKSHKVCALHNLPMYLICIDVRCKVPAKMGCHQCMEKYHNHRPTQVCKTHKKKLIKFCVSKMCQQRVAVSCEECLIQLHNHDKQDLIDLDHFRSLFTQIYQMPHSIEQIKHQKDILRNQMKGYIKKVKSEIGNAMIDLSNFIESSIVNPKFAQLDKAQRTNLEKVRVNMMMEFNSQQIRQVYLTLINTKENKIPLEQIKKFCQQTADLKRMVVQMDRILLELSTSEIFKEYCSLPNQLGTKSSLRKFLQRQEKKWSLQNVQEMKEVKLKAEQQVNKGKKDQKVKLKTGNEMAKQDKSSEQIKALEFENYYSKAEEFYKQRKFTQALELYAKAISVKKDNPKCHNSKGVCHYSIDQFDKAILCYDQAIRLDPKYSYAWNNKGNVLSDMGKFTQSLACYQQSVKINDKDAGAFNGMGIAYFGLLKYQQALKSYDKALQLNPKYANAYNNRGNTFYTLQKFPEAIKSYDKAIECDPTQKLFYKNKVNALQKMGKMAQAKAVKEQIK